MKTLFIALFAPWVIALPVFAWFKWDHGRALNATYDAVSLPAASGAMQPPPRFASVTGQIQERLGVTMDHKRASGTLYSDHFFPVTPVNWTPADKVHLVLRFAQRYRPLSAQDGQMPLRGEVSRDDLPVAVTDVLSKAGVQLASPYYVLDPLGQDDAQRERFAFTEYAVLVVAGIFNALVLVFGAIGVVHARRILRQTASSPPPASPP